MPRGAWIAVALWGAAAAALGETVYVTDTLRLGLHAAEDTSGQPIESLASGTRLEVLERRPNYARVRTPAGVEGWVKSAFVVTDVPARYRFAALEAELAQLQAELAPLRAAEVAPSAQPARSAEAGTSMDTAAAMQTTLARLKRENEQYEARLESYRGSVPLGWAAAALLVALLAGFIAGLWWLDALVRRRHGGFRIY